MVVFVIISMFICLFLRIVYLAIFFIAPWLDIKFETNFFQGILSLLYYLIRKQLKIHKTKISKQLKIHILLSYLDIYLIRKQLKIRITKLSVSNCSFFHALK